MPTPNTKVEEVRDETVEKYPKPIITKWRVIGSLLFSLFLAWVPFFGYTYLIAMLQSAGFDGVDVNPKVYDLVMFFLAGWTDPITKGLTIPVLSKWWELAQIGAKGGLGLFLFMFMASLFVRGVEYFSYKKLLGAKYNERPKLTLEEMARDLLLDSARDYKSFFILLGYSIIAGFMSVFSAVMTIYMFIFFGALLWLLAMMGYLAGNEYGKEISSHYVCTDHEWTEVEIKQGYGKKCAQIQIEGELVSGQRIFSDSQSTFFVTNEGAYQVDPEGKVLYYRPITRLDDSGEAKDDSLNRPPL
jgi:hypothetical protein